MWTKGSSDGRPDRHPLRVLICFRAPLGGLFRHVLDLTEGLVGRGVEVCVVCDSEDLGGLSGARLARLDSLAALGLHRIRMPRTAGLADITALRRVAALAREYDIDIIHGHGAKGGTYGRLAARLTGAVGIYTPHGGSLHYSPDTLVGRVFLGFEKLLGGPGGAILFESEFSRTAYRNKVGEPNSETRVIPNGLTAAEFEPVATPADAADILFLGEMRELKGVAVLLSALAAFRGRRQVSAVLVGSGAGRDRFKAMATELGLGDSVRFEEPMPARDAFALARIVVVPSLAESFPYVVLEAIAAGKPVIATHVGGIPEIFGPLAQRLVAPGDPEALTAAVAARLDWPDETAREAASLRDHVRRHFSTERMVAAIFAAYTTLLARAKLRHRRLRTTPGGPGLTSRETR
jgi:glycosyltransferase involved in cell wall biosynthesis